MAKYGMSMCVLGMAGELEPQGVAVNALWPRTGMHCGAMMCPCVCWGWQGSWNHREWQCGLVQVCTVGLWCVHVCAGDGRGVGTTGSGSQCTVRYALWGYGVSMCVLGMAGELEPQGVH